MSQPRSSGLPRERRKSPRPATTKPATPKPRSSNSTAPGPARDPAATREALLGAARAEFDERGYEGTDTNRIARRAGYAPQTFYRHFADKTAIFVETYHRWLEDEWKDLGKTHGKGAEEAARILLGHHARHREFRRSLRLLTTSDPAVKAARAESRRRQLESLDDRDAAKGRGPRGNARLALLLCVERIADAAADGELSDLGLSKDEEVAMLADAIRRLARPD